MPTYQVAYNGTTRVATVQANGDALPGGSVNVGSFVHDPVNDPLETPENHVIWHHVRDLLYKRSAANPANAAMFPDNITDVDRVQIIRDLVFVALVSIEIGGNATLTIAAPTHQIVVTPTPGGASNIAATYVSSDPAVATVNASGLVTRVGNGTTVITATSVDGAKTDTKTITCTA